MRTRTIYSLARLVALTVVTRPHSALAQDGSGAKAYTATVMSVAAGAIGGTYIGQGARWALWKLGVVASAGPLPQPTGVHVACIYCPPTTSQLQTMASSVLTDAFGMPFTSAMFDAGGSAGAVAESFMTQGEQIYMDALQGAAAAGAGRLGEARLAAAALSTALVDYRATTESLAGLLETTPYESPTSQLVQLGNDYATAVDRAKAECAASGLDCTQVDDLLDRSNAQFHAAAAATGAVAYPTLVGGPDAIFPDLSIHDFHDFLANTASLGADALPPQEIALADELTRQAGVSFPGFRSVGSLIAAWDATGVSDPTEDVLFDPATGDATLAQILRGTATTLSCGASVSCNGPWLDIHPLDSQLLTTPEPSAGLLVAGGLLLLGAEGARRRASLAARHAPDGRTA